MRIIGGKWRSRIVRHPHQQATRPMPDRVKESLFNMLGEHFTTPGALPALQVADMFAGSGSLGLEALSRGAAHCCFFEKDRQVVPVLEQNIQDFSAGEQATVHARDAWTAAVQAHRSTAFDLILLDPPYALARDTSRSGPIASFLQRLAETGRANVLVVLHHPADTRLADKSPFRVQQHRAYGTHAITWIQG